MWDRGGGIVFDVPGVSSTCPLGEHLKALATHAESAQAEGNVKEALESSRKGAQAFAFRLATICGGLRTRHGAGEARLERGRPPAGSGTIGTRSFRGRGTRGWASSGKAGLAGLGAIGLFLLKFKFAAFFFMTKAKFLLLGLTKASTFFSMFARWASTAQFGWQFGLGLVLSIYVHEMGHVYISTGTGSRPAPRCSSPGFGRVRPAATGDHRPPPGCPGRVGGSGLGLGRGGSCACSWRSRASRPCSWLCLAGEFVNLFNLIPIWQLDGGRAFRSLPAPNAGSPRRPSAWHGPRPRTGCSSF